jgi:hypothetical protein
VPEVGDRKESPTKLGLCIEVSNKGAATEDETPPLEFCVSESKCHL